jgi:vacuolar protein sorting-associated protein 18
MRFLDSSANGGSAVLKIEDILPFFPDFVVIDEFKDEICAALEGYSGHIASLKAEMNEATKTADIIKSDMEGLKERLFAIVENSAGGGRDERCCTCEKELLTREFYVFPCSHMFHADCLIGQVRSASNTALITVIIVLIKLYLYWQTVGERISTFPCFTENLGASR